MMLKQKKSEWEEEELERAKGKDPTASGEPRKKRRKVAALEMDSDLNFPELPVGLGHCVFLSAGPFAHPLFVLFAEERVLQDQL